MTAYQRIPTLRIGSCPPNVRPRQPYLGVAHPRIVTFRNSPPSRSLGSLTPTQPVRITNPTQAHPGSPRGAPQVECWSLGREPKPPGATGAARVMRCRSRARPGPKVATLHAFRRYLETSLGDQSQARARDMSSGCHLCRWRRL